MWYPWYGLQFGIGRYIFAAQFVKGTAILEVGCENGYGASYLVRKGAKVVVGGDISQEAIEYANAHYQKDGLDFLRLDAEQLPFRDNSFDVIVSFEVIEHLQRYEDFLSEGRRTLKDGGTFICSTPNKEVISPNSDKPWFPGHVKEFYIDEFYDVLANYFDEIAVYGLCPHYTATNRMIDKMICMPKPKVFYILKPGVIKIANVITRFTFRRHCFVALDEINEEDFDKIVDKRYQPFPLQSNSLSPLDIVAVARKYNK